MDVNDIVKNTTKMKVDGFNKVSSMARLLKDGIGKQEWIIDEINKIDKEVEKFIDDNDNE